MEKKYEQLIEEQRKIIDECIENINRLKEQKPAYVDENCDLKINIWQTMLDDNYRTMSHARQMIDLIARKYDDDYDDDEYQES